jgi:hypothetical protein
MDDGHQAAAALQSDCPAGYVHNQDNETVASKESAGQHKES